MSLGKVLCDHEHRYTKHATDLGHVTADSFRIILKKYAVPVAQRPYRHSPVIAEKMRNEIGRLVFAGILRKSYSDWASL